MHIRVGMIVVALAIVVAVVLIARGCGAASEQGGQDGQGGANTPAAPTVPASVNRDALVALIGEDFADQLIARAAESDEALWIAEHPDAYAGMAEADHKKILRLAASEELSLHYVRHYPDVYVEGQGGPVNNDDETLALAPEHAHDTGAPHFYQWDERWGYALYSSAAFGMSGCCPTAFAMVYQGATGKTDMTPYDMALLARDRGYETAQNGTDGNFLVDVAADLGLYANEVPADASEITEHLSDGDVMIANVGPGDFTDGGHYIVLAGLDSDGNVIVNDPFSIERSNKTWSAQAIAEQASGLYTFHAL